MISEQTALRMERAIDADIQFRNKTGGGYAQMCGLLQSEMQHVMSESQAEKFIADLERAAERRKAKS